MRQNTIISFFKFEVENSDLDPSGLPDVEVNSEIVIAYCQDSWDLDAFWTLQPGIWLTFCHSKADNLPASPVGKYFRTAPRISLRRKLTPKSNVFITYGRHYQYLTSMNPGMSTPMDLWFPIDSSVKPGISDHYIMGYKSELNDNFGIDIETYYKTYDNIVEYRPETDYDWNNETNALIDAYNIGDGFSYGADILLRTDWNSVSGFIGYSFGISKRTIENTNINPETDEEESYHPRYERVHQLNIVESFDLTENTGFRLFGSNVMLGTTYSFGSGQPYQEVEKAFYDEQGIHFLYSYKDRVRLPLYSRFDMSLKFKWQFSKWSLELYIQIINLFDYENVWSREAVPEIDEDIVTIEESDTTMFPRIPFIGFNITW